MQNLKNHNNEKNCQILRLTRHLKNHRTQKRKRQQPQNYYKIQNLTTKIICLLKTHQNTNKKQNLTKKENHLRQMTLNKILPVLMHHHLSYKKKRANLKTKIQHQHHRQMC